MTKEHQERLRRMKPTLAPPDDPIYRARFVAGGRRVQKTRKLHENATTFGG